MIRALAVAGLLAWAGCSLSPDYTGTHYRCDDEHRCPGSLVCIDEVCQDSLVGGLDASTDAALDGGPVADLCGASQTLVADDFEGGALDGDRWSTILTGDAVISVEDGRLAILPAADQSGGDVRSVEGFAADESRLIIEVVPAADHSSSATLISLRDMDTGVEVAAMFRDNFNLQAYIGADTVGVDDYDPVAHRFWGWEITGGEIYFATSPDGVDWNDFAYVPNAGSISTDAELSIYARNYEGDLQPFRFESVAWCTLE